MTRELPAGADTGPIVRQEGETGRTLARRELRPTLAAARTLLMLAEDAPGGVSLADLAAELHEQCMEVVGGNMTRAAAMMACQAETLNGLFNALLHMAFGNADHGGDSGSTERLLLLALKAQNQARATLETLALTPNPPAQVSADCGPRLQAAAAADLESGPSRLLEQHGNERLERRATSETARGDPPLETLGALHRAANGQG